MLHRGSSPEISLIPTLDPLLHIITYSPPYYYFYLLSYLTIKALKSLKFILNGLLKMYCI